MEKIARAAMASAAGCSGIRQLLCEASAAVMTINGGSAVPLWYCYIDGLSQAAPEKGPADEKTLKKMFAAGLESLAAISRAKTGDKTMMDALIPATQALEAAQGGADAMFSAAAAAAAEGAESTKNFASKFGRARSYGEQTIGTPDAGAVSMSAFFAGLAKKSAG
jgi:dihydroxyacetone kinase-like protein